MRDRPVRLFAEQNCGGELRCRRRGLDAEPALARAPEKAARVWIEPINRQAIRRERPQARPAPLDSLHRPVHDLLEPIDCGRDVDLLRRRIAGVRRDFVVRAQPDATVALALEVKRARRVIDERKVAKPERPTRS